LYNVPLKMRDEVMVNALINGQKNSYRIQFEKQKIWENLLNLWDLKQLNKQNFPGFFPPKMAANLPAFMTSPEQQRAQQLFSEISYGKRIADRAAISDADANKFLRMNGGIDKKQSENYFL